MSRWSTLWSFFVSVMVLGLLSLLYSLNTSLFSTVFHQQIGNSTLLVQNYYTNENTVRNSTFTKTLPFVKSPGLRLYLYSAFIINDNDQQHISALAWVHKSLKSTKMKCCLSLEDTTTLMVPATQIHPWYVTEGPSLIIVMYSCKIYEAITSIRGVSISLNNVACSSNDINFVKPITLETKQNSNIALCGKLVYGSKDGNFLIEWFEFLRYMGVKKVVIYPYKLNTYAASVLRYYESLGIVDVVSGFDMPEKDLIPREVGEKIYQVFNDELLILKDCLIRLWNYKYIAVHDTDEFMIPYNVGVNGSWINFFNEYFKANIASIAFKTSYHITSWKPANKSSHLAIGRHIDGTYPIYDRRKNVFMPSRVSPESVSTHDLAPHKGYKKLHCPSSIASIHHFRKCRPEWLTRKKVLNQCLNYVVIQNSHVLSFVHNVQIYLKVLHSP